MSSPRPKNIRIKDKGKSPGQPHGGASSSNHHHPDAGVSFSSSPVFTQATNMLAEMPSSHTSHFGSSSRPSSAVVTIPSTPREGGTAASGLSQHLATNAADAGPPLGAEFALSQEEAARRFKRHLVTRPVSDVLDTDHGSSTALQCSGGKNQEPEVGSFSSSTGYMHNRTDAGSDDEGNQADDDDGEDDEDVYNQNEEIEIVNPLELPSGDVTHHLYKWQEQADESASHRGPQRTRSFSAANPLALQSDSEWDIPFMHNQIVQPGGFRRHFVRERAWREGKPPPNILTSNFVDFIGLFGHFAGGDYPSDEDDDIDEEADSMFGQDSREASRIWNSSDIATTHTPSSQTWTTERQY